MQRNRYELPSHKRSSHIIVLLFGSQKLLFLKKPGMLLYTEGTPVVLLSCIFAQSTFPLLMAYSCTSLVKQLDDAMKGMASRLAHVCQNCIHALKLVPCKRWMQRLATLLTKDYSSYLMFCIVRNKCLLTSDNKVYSCDSVNYWAYYYIVIWQQGIMRDPFNSDVFGLEFLSRDE